MVSMTKEYRQEYYKNNKERILESMNKEVDCDVCGCKVRKCRLNKHKNTKKCQLTKIPKEIAQIEQLTNQINELKELMLNMKNTQSKEITKESN